MLTIGSVVQNFSLPDENGTIRTFKDFLGRPLVIYFYPKDDTPGCTAQACAFRDAYQDFVDQNIQVIGISKDSPASHKKFKEKYNLPFTLLSDEETLICQQFGVWVEKTNYGKTYMGIQRATFVLDASGVVTHVFEKASPTSNAEDILRVFSI